MNSMVEGSFYTPCAELFFPISKVKITVAAYNPIVPSEAIKSLYPKMRYQDKLANPRSPPAALFASPTPALYFLKIRA